MGCVFPCRGGMLEVGIACDGCIGCIGCIVCIVCIGCIDRVDRLTVQAFTKAAAANGGLRGMCPGSLFVSRGSLGRGYLALYLGCVLGTLLGVKKKRFVLETLPWGGAFFVLRLS